MITVLYSCSGCGIVDQEVEVHARKATQDVLVWMRQTVADTIAADHTIRSPRCLKRTMDNLKIPLNQTEDSFIGQQTDAVPPKG